jgi:radical SAM protein with 4Fe4S-binding SPASM domain
MVANPTNHTNCKKIVMESLPSCFYIASVKGCPYSCAMCPEHYTKPQNISEDLLRKIEPYFNNLKVLGIHGGGEPLLGNIGYFVEQSIKHSFVLHMNTTGFFLSKKISDMLLKTKLSIKFSIHAGKPDTYRKIMGQDFEKVLENIAYLVKKDREENKNSDFGFSFIVMKENIDEIEDFLKIAHKSGVENVRFMRLKPNQQILQGVKMPDREFEFNYYEQSNSKVKRIFLKRLPYYKKLAGELGIRIGTGSMELAARYFQFPFRRRRGICKAPWIGQLQIQQDGSVRPCCHLGYSLGNLNNSTLEEIWNSEDMQRIRTSFQNGRFPWECRSCPAVSGLPSTQTCKIL